MGSRRGYVRRANYSGIDRDLLPLVKTIADGHWEAIGVAADWLEERGDRRAGKLRAVILGLTNYLDSYFRLGGREPRKRLSLWEELAIGIRHYRDHALVILNPGRKPKWIPYDCMVLKSKAAAYIAAKRKADMGNVA